MSYTREIDHSWDFKDADTKEFTHCYHSYPAMMIPQVARTLINKYKPKDKCSLLLDPYMGSGTSLVEASLKGINSIGTDVNPLARFISRVKTTHYDYQHLENLYNDILIELNNYNESRVENKNFDRISNHSFWYSYEVLLKISYLNQIINKIDCKKTGFFCIPLSEIIREASYTRNSEFKRYRMTEKSIESFKPDVFNLFKIKVLRNFNGLKSYNAKATNTSVQICDFNTVVGIPSDLIKENQVDMVLTSPPYGDSRTTVAYGQFSRWSNEWFNFENAKKLDSILMGGKPFTRKLFSSNSISYELDKIHEADVKRYKEVISFLNDYYRSISNVSKVVRSGGVICYVVGNRKVKGIQIPLDYFTAEMFEQNGFKHIKTIVRQIPNKRMPSKTSPTNISGKKIDTMSNEYIVIMTKV